MSPWNPWNDRILSRSGWPALAIGVALTVSLFLVARGYDEERFQADFIAESGELADAVLRYFHSNIEILHSLEQLNAEDEDVDKRDFRTFVWSALGRHPDILAIEWIPRILSDDVASFEIRLAHTHSGLVRLAEPSSAGMTVASSVRDTHYPVLFVEPEASNEKLRGLDLWTVPAVRDAMVRSLRTGAPMLTAPIPDPGTSEIHWRVKLVLPVPDRGRPMDTPEQRLANHSGFVALVLSPQRFVETALGWLDARKAVITISDATRGSPSHPLVRFDQGKAHSLLGSPEDLRLPYAPGFQWTTSRALAGRTWEMTFRPTEAFGVDRIGWKNWALAASGLFLSVVLALYLSALERRNVQVERLVLERTEEAQREVFERRQTETLLRAEKERFLQDLQVAAGVQRSLLPPRTLDLGGLHVVTEFRPCETVGGDVFNLFALPQGRVGLFCVDVSGHGVQAALLSVALSKLLSLWPIGASLVVTPEGGIRAPREVAGLLNHQFCEDQKEIQAFTLFYGVYDPSTCVLDYVRAGHPLPIHLPASGIEVRSCHGGDAPIGYAAGIEYREYRQRFEPGDRLIIHSDGISEAATSRSGERFGTERIARSLLATRALPLEVSVARLFEEFAEFRAGLAPQDDVTLLALEIV